jgi:hypothetical protein
MGGGIATSIERDTLWIVIVDNGIDSNYVISNKTLGGCTGGGLAIINNCRISNNIIKNNVAKNLINTSYWAQGAGACIFSIFDSLNKVAIIQNNQFLNNSNNSNKAYGGGMKAAGGMHFTISNNTFIGNRVESNISITDCWGAGLEAGNFLPGSVISGNTFKNNYSEKTYGGLMLYSAFDNIEPVLVENNYFINNVAETYGGALGNDYCHIILQNNVFSGNHAGIRGGALYLNCSYSVTELYHHLAIILNNSFSENTATYGGAIYSYYAKPLIINSIFWGDSAANGPEIYLAATSDTVEIAYSTINPDFIHGNLNVGGNNINEDPLYTHPELLTIGDFSPCKNAGTEVYTCHCGDLNNCPHYDINGTTRPLNGGFDMGAWEEIMTGIPGRGIPNSELRIANWPNPVISSAIFSYFLQEPSSVTIQIFNSVGQIVDEPLKCWQQKGDQKIKWNSGSLPAGMYYYRIQAGKQLGSGKMVKN